MSDVTPEWPLGFGDPVAPVVGSGVELAVIGICRGDRRGCEIVVAVVRDVDDHDRCIATGGLFVACEFSEPVAGLRLGGQIVGRLGFAGERDIPVVVLEPVG